ncbi:hypothetical protein BH11MYX1_BH11MYX1_40300 [soil metagenome]
MRFTTIALISLVCACGGVSHGGPAVPKAAADVAEFAALAYVPNQPTYLVTAHTVLEAQTSVIDTLDSLGMVVGASSRDAGKAFQELLGVDPLTAAGLAKLGVDPRGSFAVFAESAYPTILVKLTGPEMAQSYFSEIRNRMATRSVVVEGVEVVTAPFMEGSEASWAIDKQWLWVHFGKKGGDPSADWFSHSHHAAGSAWATGLGWAKHVRDELARERRPRTRTSGLLGFFDSHALLALARIAAPELGTCLDRFQPIGFGGFAIEGDGYHCGGSLAFELGPAAQSISAALLPPPPGFEAVAAKAPIAVQWNLDLAAVASFIAPCVKTAGGDTASLTKYGMRTLRLAVQTLDPSDKSGTGVIAADLSDKAFLAELLDQIPKRSFFESDHRYGAFAGHRLSIPFVAKVDYVLDGSHGFAAMGDGLMDKLVMGASTAIAPPVFQLDLIPAGFSEAVWNFVIATVTNEWFAKRASSALLSWHDGHVRVTIDHDALVIDAAGNRR